MLIQHFSFKSVVTVMIQNHILTTQPSDHKSSALNRSTMEPQCQI